MNNAGRIGFLVRGEYDSSATYDYLDVVLFKNSSYVAKKTTIGNEPAEDSEYWQILAKTPDSTVTGVKGNAEAVFRTGEINITPENIGALPSNGTAASAIKLSEASTIDGVVFDGSADISHYGTCTTEGATVEKAVSMPGFILTKGAMIAVYFNNKNTAQNPTLNVNGTGARSIRYNGAALNSINSGILSGCCAFAYNGTYWYLMSASITTENIGLGNVDNTHDADKSVANADTIDGKHASDFAASSHTHTGADISDVSDSVSAGALSSASNKLVTERDVYYGLPKINNSHTYNSNTNIYAPASGGGEGYELIGNGTTSAPVWKAPNFAVCNTASSTVAKTISISNFKLIEGASVDVLFTDGNTAKDITLNVSGTGAKPIVYRDDATYLSGIIKNNMILHLVYHNNKWNIISIPTYLDGSDIPDVMMLRAGYFTSGGNAFAFRFASSAADIAPSTFCPTSSSVRLGCSYYRWGQIYSTQSTIATSDRNEKKEIKNISESYEKLFMMLQPKSFMHKDGDRIHIGAISQDVEDAMNEVGLKSTDFGGFCKDHKAAEVYDENGNLVYDEKNDIKLEYLYDEDGTPIYTYSLRYEEFIFLTIHMVQKNIQRLQDLEERLSALEEAISR